MEDGTSAFSSGEREMRRRLALGRKRLSANVCVGLPSSEESVAEQTKRPNCAHMRLWSSQSCAREIPEDELAIFADRSEAHCPLVGPPRIPRYSSDPRRVSLTASDDPLLERSVDGTEVILTAGLQGGLSLGLG